MDLSIIIPCLNEAENAQTIKDELFPVLNQLAQTHSLEVIFIDDGSTDNTWEVFNNTFGPGSTTNLTVRFEKHPVNKGLGAAIRTGFAAAEGDIVITTDSDGTYKFSEIPNLLSYLTPEVDIVTASPYHPDGGMIGVPRYRLILSQGASALYRLLADSKIHTYTALFRAYRRPVTQDVPFESNGFLGGTELLINAMRMGYKVVEYPAILHSRVHGESKAKLARTIKSHLTFQTQVLIPWHPYGMILQGSDDKKYLYTNFQKRLFPSEYVFLSYGYHPRQITRVSDKYLAGLDSGQSMSFREGTLLRGSDKAVFFIEHNKKRPFLSAAVFEGLGYQWENILVVPDQTLTEIEMGEEINSVDVHPDGTIVRSPDDETAYLLKEGQKYPFNSEQIFLSWGYKWNQIITIPEEELNSYKTGLPIVPQKSFYQEIQQVDTNIETKQSNETNLLRNLPSAIYWTLNRHALQLKHKL